MGNFINAGNACREKVRKFLKQKFTTISEAEEAYNINYFGDKNFLATRKGDDVPGACTPIIVHHGLDYVSKLK